jgi:type IV secretion system protein VirD4
MLSRTIGDTTIEYDTVSTSRGTGSGKNRAGLSESVSGHVSACRLATHDQIMWM